MGGGGRLPEGPGNELKGGGWWGEEVWAGGVNPEDEVIRELIRSDQQQLSQRHVDVTPSLQGLRDSRMSHGHLSPHLQQIHLSPKQNI